MADIRFVIDVDGVEKVVRLRQETEKVAPAAKNAGDKLDKMSRKVAGYGNTTNGARKNTNRMNAAIQNAGYQFGDFFVQVQSGQNALVAFSQQGTQLAGILPGIAGAVGGLAVVLGSQLALALTRNSNLLKSFSEIVKDADEAISGFTNISRKLASAVGDELGPAVTRAYEVLGEARIEQAIKNTDAALEKTLKKSEAEVKELNNEIKGTELLLRQVYTAIEDNAELSFFDVRNVGELEQKLAELKADLQAVNIDTIFSEVSNLDFNNVDDLSQTMMVVAERAKLLAESGRISQDRFEELESLTFTIADQIRFINEQQGEQKEELEEILSFSEEILAVEKERASLAESIEETFKRTAIQAGLVEEGMARGMAGQVASMQMKLDQEKALLQQLGEAGFLQPGTVGAMLLQREQGFAQYKADLAKLNARTAPAPEEAAGGTSRGGYFRTEEQFMESYNRLRQYNLGMKELDGLSKDVSTSFVDMFRSITDGTKTATEAFRDMTLDIAKRILDLLIYQPMINALTNSLSSALGVPGMAMAGATRGGVIPFANGGVVGSPTYFGMSGGRTGLMGEAGPEAILPLKRGPGGKLGVEGGGNVTVNQSFNFAANGDESVKKIIAQAAPGIAKMTEAQIVNSRQRGGQMRRVFS